MHCIRFFNVLTGFLDVFILTDGHAVDHESECGSVKDEKETEKDAREVCRHSKRNI
jgi:hypothetical protein